MRAEGSATPREGVGCGEGDGGGIGSESGDALDAPTRPQTIALRGAAAAPLDAGEHAEPTPDAHSSPAMPGGDSTPTTQPTNTKPAGTTTTKTTAAAPLEQGKQPTAKQRRPRPQSAAEARRVTLPHDSADQFSPSLPAVSENRVARPRARRATSSDTALQPKPSDSLRKPRPRTRRHSAPDVLNRPATSAIAVAQEQHPRLATRLATSVDAGPNRKGVRHRPILLQSDSRRGATLVDHRGCRLQLK